MVVSRTRSVHLLLALLLPAIVAACADKAVAPESEPQATGPAGSESVGIVNASEGLVLNGKLFGSANETGVVLAHMRRGDQTAWFDFAERLAREGYAALTFDFRGFGSSGGSEDLGKLDDDLQEAVRYLREDRRKSRIFVIGASMGGSAALVVAADGGLLGVVAISAPDNFEGQDAVAAVARTNAPKLLIASEDDTAAMLSVDKLLDAAIDPKDSQTYAGNLHGTDLLQPGSEHAQAIEDLILRFLRENSGG